MRQALLNPVAIEAYFVKQRGAGPAQIVNRERLQRQSCFLCARCDELGNPVQGSVRHAAVNVIARGLHEFGASGTGVQRHKYIQGLVC
ncbi:hypothetical protein D3C84_792090 [compost metagenome]